MAFRKYHTTEESARARGLRVVPGDPIEAHLIRLLDRYRTAYEPEDLEDYLAILEPLEPLREEEFRQACRAWLGAAEHRRAPHPGELKALLEAQRRQAQPQELESWQRPPPARMSHAELQAILAGLKPGLR
jgi:hypothetical protein